MALATLLTMVSMRVLGRLYIGLTFGYLLIITTTATISYTKM